jgi:D-alanine--poly(phosphoribitol) ligase subunit 2
MTEAEVVRRLHAFFRATFPHPGQDLELDTDLLEEWFVDSFGIVQTVQFVEDTFHVAIDRADIHADNFTSIRTLTAFVRRKLG